MSKLYVRRGVRGLALEGRRAGRRLRRRWRSYLIQCGLTALALLLVLLVVDVVLRAAIVVAIASTAFIVFLIPHSRQADSRRVIGGHVVAIVVGSAFFSLYLTPALGDLTASHFAHELIAVASVGVSMLLMVLTSTEHPPAAGTALGLAFGDWHVESVLFVAIGVALIVATHRLLRSRLTNLL